MNKTTQPNILFYLESCKTCAVFINTAQQHGVLKYFKMICIDGQKEKFKNQGLKKVPTIIITSINKQYDGSDCIKWLNNFIKNSSDNSISKDELIVPDLNLYNNSNLKQNLNQDPVNLLNTQVSQISTQINQLATQIKVESNNNQFEINKNNTIKRNKITVVQPPLINNSKQKQDNQQNNQQNINTTIKPINQLFGFLQNEMSGFSDSYAYINIDNPLPKSFLPPDKDMEIYTAPEGDKINKKKQIELMENYEIERNNQKNKFAQDINELNNKIAGGDANSMHKWLNSNPNL
jgi:hypothetical protein